MIDKKLVLYLEHHMSADGPEEFKRENRVLDILAVLQLRCACCGT